MTYNELYKALSIKPATADSKHFTLSTATIPTTKKLPKPIIALTDIEICETTTEEEGKQYKFPHPKLTPDHLKHNILSEEDRLRLEYNFKIAKAALHEFKNLMRAAGIDVSSFDIRITNDRLDFSKIPDQYRSAFEIILKNNLSAHSFKARGTHKSLTHPFMRHLQHENTSYKLNQHPDLKPSIDTRPTPFQSPYQLTLRR